MPQYDYRPYVGLPYEPPLGCFALVRKVYGEQYGIELADAPEDASTRSVYQSVLQRKGSNWRQIAECDTKEGDVVLFRFSPWHVGVVISPPDVLHCLTGETACVQSWRDMQLRDRIEGFYRYGRQ